MLTRCTADFAFLLMINALRRAGKYARAIHSGWTRPCRSGEFLGRRLSGKTLGIVGLGRIGQAPAQRARAFGMTIRHHDVAPIAALAEGCFPTLHALLPVCDVLSPHAPAAADNHRMIDLRAAWRCCRAAPFRSTRRVVR